MKWLAIILLIILFGLLIVILRSPHERKRFKTKAKGVWQDLYFWLSLLFEDAVSIGFTIVACLTVFFFVLFKKIPAQVDSIILSLLVALVFPTFIGLIRRFANYGKALEKVDLTTLSLTEKLIEFIQDASISTYKKSIIVKDFFDNYPKDFGGIIIGADEKTYIKKLVTLLPLTQKSFYATLRGGKEPTYSIGWFFTSSPDHGLTAEEKKEYLRKVNKARHIEDKIRLLLFKHHELKDFSDQNSREKFLELNNKIQLYLADPEEIEKYLIENRVNNVTLSKVEAAFIWEDYAIFDSEIILKHNGQNSLYLGMAKQISNMLLPFKLLEEQPTLFQKIDSKGIYSWNDSSKEWNTFFCTWEKWTIDLCECKDCKEKKKAKNEYSADKT